MKEYDIVKLLVDRPRYQRAGVKKGMFGVIMSADKIEDSWQVIFSEFGSGRDIADIEVKEADLKVVERVTHDMLIPEQISKKPIKKV